jgi:aminoglycoside phosphotransferase (APT) family kinase protein
MGEKPLEVAPEKIESLVRRVFPGAKIETCLPYSLSATSLNYSLNLTNPTMELTFKLYLEGQPRREAHTLKRVAQQAGVTVPHLLHYDDSLVTLSRPYALLTRPAGLILATALPRLAAEDVETVGYEMGRYLARLHAIPCARYGEYCGEGERAGQSEQAYTLTRLGESLEGCRQNDLLAPEVGDDLQRLCQETAVLNREEPCLVHGDFQAANVSVEEGYGACHVTAFLNFENALAWSPEWDMVQLFGALFDDYPPLQEGFLAGYGAAGQLPEHFWGRLELYRLLFYVERMWRDHRRGEVDSVHLYREQLESFLAGR